MNQRVAQALIALLGVGIAAIGLTKTDATALGILAVGAGFLVAIPLGYALILWSSARGGPRTADTRVPLKWRVAASVAGLALVAVPGKVGVVWAALGGIAVGFALCTYRASSGERLGQPH